MITSLMDMLRDCLPIHAGWSQAQDESGAPEGYCPPASYLKRYLKPEAPGTPMHVDAPPLPNQRKRLFERISQAWSLTRAERHARLWGLKFQPPNQVVEVQCRAREDGYRLHGVLPRVTFGLNGEPLVRVTVKDTGQVLDLPLDTAHLFAQFLVKGGHVPEGRRTMWPLEALHDSGFVVVYVYEPSVDLKGQIALPLAPFTPSGRGNWTPVRIDEWMVLKEMAPPGDQDAWLEAMTGPFIDVGGAGQFSLPIDGSGTTKIIRPRILVVLSVGTLRERADFEPGGIVGMAKIVPNIMVASAVELASMEATVKVERTASTTTLDEGDGSTQGTCCGAYKQIGAMLVTDDNTCDDVQKPFWGGTFAYVETDADKRLGGQRLHVVDRSKKTRRHYPGGKRLLVTRVPITPTDVRNVLGLSNRTIEGVDKSPGQGEFDNLHLAPSLKLDLAKMEIPAFAAEGAYVPPIEYKVDPAACHTDKVWMAPFCSHDCFHTHWRWGEHTSPRWTQGWDSVGPHRVAGAPMIPVHQDAWMELHGPNSYSYHAKSTYDKYHEPGTWDIVMHHGCAYAQAISNFTLFTASKLHVSLSNDGVGMDSKGMPLSLKNAPFMYWLLRYQVDYEGDHVVVTDRIQSSQGDIDGARKF